MRVTVLGKSPSWQDAGGACSGYLVEHEGVSLLLDCGNGVFAKLRQHLDYVDLDAVVLSHLHADHFLDLVPYSYALTYAPRQQPVPVHVWPGTDSPARPVLHAPTGATETFRRVVGAWGNEDLIENAFDLREYTPEDVITVGGMTVRFHQVPHFIPTNAICISDGDGRRFIYGADCSPTDGLVEFAQGAELMFIEATLPRPERQGPRGHLTPGEAGEHGSRAHVKRLVLTHISDELGDDWALESARETYDGPLEVARDGASYEI